MPSTYSVTLATIINGVLAMIQKNTYDKSSVFHFDASARAKLAYFAPVFRKSSDQNMPKQDFVLRICRRIQIKTIQF